MHHIADEEWINPAALNRLEAAEREATPRKWVTWRQATHVSLEAMHHIESVIGTFDRGSARNAYLCAIMRNALPDLIAAARRDLWQREQIDWLWKQLHPDTTVTNMHAQTAVQSAAAEIRELRGRLDWAEGALEHLLRITEDPPTRPDHSCGPETACDLECAAYGHYRRDRWTTRAALEEGQRRRKERAACSP